MPYVYDFDHPHHLPAKELAALVGGKAANLSVMSAELGLPVPPGFTVSTEACRAYLASGWPAGLDDELRAHMRRVEASVGRRFGDASDPLLVSVRSGAPVSMPGMMDTILNLGLTPATVDGLAAATGNPAFASDCRRRFETMYRDIVGVEAPADPWEQLRSAVEAVFRSWNSDRAKAYRRREAIPDALGTGVTVQAMVFGNRGPRSATGVLFTRNPSTGAPTLYGDLMFEAQGEDVVAGTHKTESIDALDGRLPAVARELREYARRLERHYADLCDIEFTIEEGKLWLLQVRVGKRSPQAALRIALDMAEEPDFPLSREAAVRRVAPVLANPPRASVRTVAAPAPLAVGLPASPGVASGEIVTTPDAAVAAADAGRTVILVRSETSPDDVHGMARSAGVLTARGGLASHAAVVARGWGIPAVVGLSGLDVRSDGIALGGRTLAAGETITIDGTSGEVFAGTFTGVQDVVPECATLLDWARELGVSIGDGQHAARAGSATPDAGEAGREAAAASAGESATGAPGAGGADVVRVLLIKGLATPEALATLLPAAPEQLTPLIERLVADGLVEHAAGALRLTGAGKLRGLDIFEADREVLGALVADEALEGFLALDRRMKDTVTAWQLKATDGEQAINDHTDAAYDAAVLERLAALHTDTLAWLAPLCVGLPRLSAYRNRLESALTLARGGDGRFVASPRVDSYHGVWFELHEELIRLAGRKRADEAAAGRA